MSVYTHLEEKDIHQLLEHYNLGSLTHYAGVEGGVENTNYFIDTEKNGTLNHYVLTLFEYLPTSMLPFFIQLTDELCEGGLPVPESMRDRSGQALHTTKDKPSLIVSRLSGDHPTQTSLSHCTAVGETLALIHKIGQSSTLHQENQRGMTWLNSQQQRLQPLISQSDADLMQHQWRDITQKLSKFKHLPKGLIHGDLFQDNVLFTQDKITGVIDFYNACNDWLVYDVAVTINDWCLDSNLSLNPQKSASLLRAYHKVRPFTQEEREAWPTILRLAAFRFWISRIITFIHPEKISDDLNKESLHGNVLDPNVFKNMLIQRTTRLNAMNF